MTSIQEKTGRRIPAAKTLLLAVLLCLAPQAFAAITSITPSGGTNGTEELLSIDLPEGFIVTDAEQDGSAFLLENTVVPVKAAVRLYGTGKFSSAEAALTDVLGRFRAQGETESFVWRNQDCALASFSGSIGGLVSGYALAAERPQAQGFVVLLSWAAAQHARDCTNFMLSFLDSLNIDFGSFYSPGPVSEYVYPAEGASVPVTLSIGGRSIRTELKEIDAEAAEGLIEREYKVLCHYQQSELWQEAWQRYYRMIFRDSFNRLQRASFDIYNALAPYCTDETDLAQKLLTWTQGFSYERKQTASDFANLPSMLLGGGSDCDSRAMLLGVLLKNMNMETVMFVSAEFSHALAGFVSTHPGHSFTVGDKEFLMGETTTAGVTWGMIAKDMDDQGKWITVEFP